MVRAIRLEVRSYRIGKLRLVRKEGKKTNDRRSEQRRGGGKEQWQLPDFKREGSGCFIFLEIRTPAQRTLTLQVEVQVVPVRACITFEY